MAAAPRTPAPKAQLGIVGMAARFGTLTDLRELERAILDLLSTRPAGATICPSEAARRVAGEDWRASMESVRRAARRLVARGHLEITQGGRVVDPTTAVGPIRLRRAP